jgi:CheY-like chemotaxis protein
VASRDSSVRPPSVLIVEDEVLVRMALAEHLQECGYRAFEASSAAEAVKVLGDGEVTIHLVFTDVCACQAKWMGGASRLGSGNINPIPL